MGISATAFYEQQHKLIFLNNILVRFTFSLSHCLIHKQINCSKCLSSQRMTQHIPLVIVITGLAQQINSKFHFCPPQYTQSLSGTFKWILRGQLRKQDSMLISIFNNQVLCRIQKVLTIIKLLLNQHFIKFNKKF